MSAAAFQEQLSFEPAAPTVGIRGSPRRRKTIGAHWEGETIVVLVPPRLSKKDRQIYADELSAKLIARRDRERPTDEALADRAAALSARYLDGRARPTAVTWSSRQGSRWGSCTPADGTIRVSDRLKDVPAWVLDAVLVHELAHLLHDDHGPEFNALVDRFPRTADSDVFLSGYSLGLARGT
jgi:predicted metal-dependent hydrolase